MRIFGINFSNPFKRQPLDQARVSVIFARFAGREVELEERPVLLLTLLPSSSEKRRALSESGEQVKKEIDTLAKKHGLRLKFNMPDDNDIFRPAIVVPDRLTVNVEEEAGRFYLKGFNLG